MNQNETGLTKDEGIATVTGDPDLPEILWAARDFALEVKIAKLQPKRARDGKMYEVRPCKSVRGHVLSLPVTGWAFWFPTLADALSLTQKLTGIYRADCCVYDSQGGVLSRPSILESPGAPAH